MKNFKLALILFLGYSASTFGQIEISLRKSFIDSLKNHISIKAEYFVVKAHDHPNSGSKDGDLHIAGYDNGIGLATVAEIMNAKKFKDAMKIIHTNEGQNNPVSMTGVWRLWCEHPGEEATFKQGNKSALDNIQNTNPDHAFEIHPVLMVEEHSLITGLKRIEGYTYKNASNAFNAYSNVRCKLKDKGDNISIYTNGIGYNYVDFWIEIIDSTQFVVDDGRFVMCSVLDANGDVLVRKMRMAFPLDSKAEIKIRTKHQGDRMRVAGVPRMSLALISYRIEHANDFDDILEWNLPVEIVVVSVVTN